MITSAHQSIDNRLLQMVRACVVKIDSRPELLRIAHENLSRVTNRRVYSEWTNLLSVPWVQLRAILVEDSERGRALRQNAPFAGLLTAAERRGFYDKRTA